MGLKNGANFFKIVIAGVTLGCSSFASAFDTLCTGPIPPNTNVNDCTVCHNGTPSVTTYNGYCGVVATPTPTPTPTATPTPTPTATPTPTPTATPTPTPTATPTPTPTATPTPTPTATPTPTPVPTKRPHKPRKLHKD